MPDIEIDTNSNDININIDVETPQSVNLEIQGSSQASSNVSMEALYGPKGDKGDKGDTGPQGPQGEQGPQGADGYSPTANVSKSDNTTTITITDKNGTTTAEILDGTDGQDGADGSDGEDGFSPIATVTETETGATISITDANGTTTANILNGIDGQDGSDGQDGQDGQDGYSPTATVTKSGNTATITITDKNGTTTAQVSDGVGSITDVQKNGVSVVSSGIANVTVPTATSDLTNDSGFITSSDIPTQTQADWSQSDNTQVDFIKNKPTLATVATSGSYNDLSDTPIIPDVSTLANKDLSNLSNNGNARLQYAPFSINNGGVDANGDNATLTYSGATLTCQPCTITTCDSRTKTFENNATLDCSTLADGTYRVLKDYETGALSVIDDFIIAKTSPLINVATGANGISSTISDGTLASAFDGDTTTRVNLYDSTTIIGNWYIGQKNLTEQIKQINFYQGGGINYNHCVNSVIIQISEDNTNWTNIQTVTNLNEGTASSSVPSGYKTNIVLNNYTVPSNTYSMRLLANSNTGTLNASWSINEVEFLAVDNTANYLNKNTPMKFYINGSLDNDKVYIGNVTISSGAISSISNCGFNQFYNDTIITSAHELDIDNALEISTTLQTAYVDYTPTKSGLLVITVGCGVTSNTANSLMVYILAVDSNGNTFTLDGTQMIKPTGTGLISYVAKAVVVKGKPYQYYMSAAGSGATKSGSAVFIPFKNAN